MESTLSWWVVFLGVGPFGSGSLKGPDIGTVLLGFGRRGRLPTT